MFRRKGRDVAADGEDSPCGGFRAGGASGQRPDSTYNAPLSGP